MNKNDWIAIVASFVFLSIFIIFYRNRKDKDIKENHSISCGTISNYYFTTKGITTINYFYFVNGKQVTGGAGNKYFKDCEKTGWCIGKCYVVEYSSKNPENSRMNFDKPCNCDSINIEIPPPN
jgi:hypothetical protein